MRVLQEVLLKLVSDYAGHPYYVSGHAIWTAIARQLDNGDSRALSVSNGVFVPGDYGEYPPSHSETGRLPNVKHGLRPVKAYDDLFLYRDPSQRWLSDARPRDGHNSFHVQNCGGRLMMASERRFGQPAHRHAHQRMMNWYVHCFISLNYDSDTVLGRDDFPLDEQTLDGLRLGARRNFGFGETELVDTQTIDMRELDYSRLEAASSYRIELVSPYVLWTEAPNGDPQSVPGWWGTDGQLRRRTEQLVSDATIYTVETIDHGQVVRYTGDSPVETGQNGVCRIGTHSKFGFGEFRLRPICEDRVAERQPKQGHNRATVEYR